jgi:hypothetical protein
MLFLLLIAINSLYIVAEGRSGLDLSVSSTLSNWNCLVGQYNISFAIARVYRYFLYLLTCNFNYYLHNGLPLIDP